MVNAVRFLLAVGTRDLFSEYLTQAPLPPCDSIRLGRLMECGLNFLFLETYLIHVKFRPSSPFGILFKYEAF